MHLEGGAAPIPARALGRRWLRSEALPGLVLALTSTFCLFAAVATTTVPAPQAMPRRGIASAAGTIPDRGTPIRIPIVTASASEIRCLARAMWHEAGSEPREGQIAVGEVVLARTKDSRFASTACAVLRQASQFSFVHHGSIPAVPEEHAEEMTALARKVIAGVASSRVGPKSGRALFFHATWAKPVWRHDMKQVARIGGHVFYRG